MFILNMSILLSFDMEDYLEWSEIDEVFRYLYGETRETISMNLSSYQYNVQKSKKSDRGLDEYDRLLENVLPEGIFNYMRGSQYHLENPVWVDVCCGQGRALIDAINKQYESKNDTHMSFIGIDIRKLETHFDIKYDNCALSFVNQDINDLSCFQVRPNLITDIFGLCYVSDPLSVVENLYNSLEKNGILISLGLNKVSVKDNKVSSEEVSDFKTWMIKRMDKNLEYKYSIGCDGSDNAIVCYFRKLNLDSKLNLNLKLDDFKLSPYGKVLSIYSEL